MMRTLVSLAAALALCAAPGAAQNPAARWAAVDSAVGRAGMAQDGGVWAYRFPRRDLTVKVGDATVMPGLALRSWSRSGGPAPAPR